MHAPIHAPIDTQLRTHTMTHFHATFVAMLALLTGVLSGAMITPSAAAQVEPIDPVWMVAARDTPLRSGDMSTFYEITTLKRGAVVRVDGRDSRWARVIYPADLYGFVRKEDANNVDVSADGTGTITVDSIEAIKAPNRISGLSGSWKSIDRLSKIDPGTTLEVVGEAFSKNDQMIGYRVKPLQPPLVNNPPYGYVQLAAVRAASQDEVDAHLASLRQTETKPAADDNPEGGTDDGTNTGGETTPADDDAPASKPENTDQTTEAEEADADAADTPPATEDGTDNSANTADDSGINEATADDSLIDDMAIPTPGELDSAEQDTPADSDTESDNNPGAADSDTTTSPSAPQNAQQVTPQQRDYLLWEELEATLTRVRRAGGATLLDSLDELVAEYERSLANTDTPTVRAALSNRLEWLRARKTARDQRLALEAALRDAKQINVDVQKQQESWRVSRGYDIVGRLVPSAIYDGTNLPRMYRVVVEGEAGLTRTIGYVRDNQELSIAQLVGSIVGVAGTARYDDALRLRVITPSAINRFQPTAAP